ncbi:MAG: rod shape-determining protein MreC [Bacteroidales bacterium]|jgi:rod shape-determining protein MreC|nr:rod shape-determining protein MreC [Bacteroidales bacterium]
MRNLLNFLLKYNNLIVFLILEVVALALLTSANSFHNSRIVKGSLELTARLESKINNARAYIGLREINSALALENSILKNTLERFTSDGNMIFNSVSDSVYKQNYRYTTAEVINNSVNKQKNFFTLNKGNKSGITPDMAVITNNSVAGVVVGCSENFSVAISLLNIDFRVSARIRSSGYFGSLGWGGRNYRQAQLSEIPQHVNISVGDTVETTGYSTIFPEGLMIGRISDFRKSGSDFYTITVDLASDFRKLRYVDVAGNLNKAEQTKLENQFQ